MSQDLRSTEDTPSADASNRADRVGPGVPAARVNARAAVVAAERALL